MKHQFSLIAFILVCFTGQIHAQNTWLNSSQENQQSDTVFDVPYAQPVKIVYHIPIKMDHSYHYYPRNGQPSSGDNGVSVGVIDETPILYEPGNPLERSVQKISINDRITLINISPYDSVYDKRIISFNIDTIAQQLRDLFIYHYSGDPNGPIYCINCIWDTLLISSIPYHITLNHHLISSLQGNDLFRQIARVYYYMNRTYGDYYNGHGDNIYESRGDPIDTSTCSFSIDLTTTDTTLSGINATKELNGEFLHVYSNDPSDLLTFSFSSSDHNRELKIYDLLGKEVNKSLIPSGATSFMMSKNLLCEGCYFALLGNRSEKFFLQR